MCLRGCLHACVLLSFGAAGKRAGGASGLEVVCRKVTCFQRLPLFEEGLSGVFVPRLSSSRHAAAPDISALCDVTVQHSVRLQRLHRPRL